MGLKIVNQAFGILASGITSGATTITLQTGHGARFGTLLAGEFLFCTLISNANQLEVVKVTAIAGDVLTAVRGQDGTTAIAFAAGERIEDRPCRAAMLEFLLKSDFGSYADTLGLVPTTGDVQPTFKTVAKPTWVMMNDGSIGNAASGGTTRANADTEALFTLLWNNIINTWAPVSGGRGASAVADFAANKTLTLPKALGRALAVSGTGAGLTARALGENLGKEKHALTDAENGPHVHGVNDPGHAHTSAAGPGPGSPNLDPISANTQQLASVGTSTGVNTGGITIQSAGAGTPHENMQPSAFMNVMIKL